MRIVRRSFSLSVSNFVTLGGSPTAAVFGVSGWRSIFLLAGICLLAMSLAWLLGITRIEKRVPVQEKQTQVLHQTQKKEFVNNSTKRNGILLQSGLIVLLAALFVQGALKDGVTTWIPVYIQETYGISPILAVAGTMVIPLCNLFGMWLAAVACRHMERNEIAVSAGFFAVCAAMAAFSVFVCGFAAKKWGTYRRKLAK